MNCAMGLLKRRLTDASALYISEIPLSMGFPPTLARNPRFCGHLHGRPSIRAQRDAWGGPSRLLTKPRWLGGPIKAIGFDEIVDFMVAVLTQQLCYQPRKLLEFRSGWRSSAKNTGACRMAGQEDPGKICVRRVTFGRVPCLLPALSDFILTLKFQTSIIAPLH
jgi:hypothetical protein